MRIHWPTDLRFGRAIVIGWEKRAGLEHGESLFPGNFGRRLGLGSRVGCAGGCVEATSLARRGVVLHMIPRLL